jgi:hypothetical protein
MESSAYSEAITQRILNRPARAGEEAFEDCSIEVTGGDSDSFEPVLNLSV